MKIPHRTLSVRTYLFVLVLSMFLPIVAIFGWNVMRELRDARDEAYARVKLLADETAENVQAILDNNEVVLGRLAARPLIQALDPGKCDSLIADYVSLHPEFSTLALRDSNANIVCTLLPSTFRRPGEATVLVPGEHATR